MLTHHRSLIVGIAGGSASGKSALTSALCQALTDLHPAMTLRVVHTDSYFKPGSPEMPTLVLSSGERSPDYNRPDSIDLHQVAEDLDAISQAEDAPDVLIVEGLMVLHSEEIRERLDLRLFVELDADTRALRRLIRNLERPGDPISDQGARSIATYYLESAKVGHERYVEPSCVHADLILRGDADFARIARMLAAVIDRELAGIGS
jgi:uridine kinase